MLNNIKYFFPLQLNSVQSHRAIYPIGPNRLHMPAMSLMTDSCCDTPSWRPISVFFMTFFKIRLNRIGGTESPFLRSELTDIRSVSASSTFT